LEIWRDDDGKLAVELEATVEIAGLPVKVFIDRVMTGPPGLVIVDLKSGANMPKDGMQLAIYAHAIKAVYGLDVQWGQFWSARDGASSVSYSVSEWPMERLAYISRFGAQDAGARYLYSSRYQHVRVVWGATLLQSVWWRVGGYRPSIVAD